MILFSKLTSLGVHFKLTQASRHIGRRCVGTINYDRSLEHGLLIPDINLEEVGVSSVIGARKYQEDRFVVQSLKDGSVLLGVFDGHGGSLAASYTQKHLPSILENLLDEHKERPDIAGILENAFLDVSANLLTYVRKSKAGKNL